MVQLNLGTVQMDTSIAQLIVAIIAVFLAMITLLKNFRDKKPKTKYRLFIYPDQGYVTLGGSITSTLRVKGSYKNKVELSVLDIPPGVFIAFAPDVVVPKRFFNFFNKSSGTSTISITVDRDAEDGRYPIEIVGTEVIGSGSSTSSSHSKWQNSCTYNLYCASIR